MQALIAVVVAVLPWLLRLVRGALIVRRGVTIVPFILGVISSITLMYAYWHEVNVGVTAALSGMQASLANIPIGTSDALCWVSAFGVFQALRIIVQAVGVGLSMLITQFIALNVLKVTNHLLEAAVEAVHR